MKKDKPFYKSWEFWILGIAVIILTVYEIYSNNSANKRFEEIFNRLAKFEESHVPLEELKIEIPSTKEHSNMSEKFTATIPVSYSGEKTATYFVEWDAVNSKGNKDHLALLASPGSSISTIKEKDGAKNVTKDYKFLKKDVYTISATFYYYIGSDEELGSNEIEIKNFIKNDKNLSKSRKVSFEVIVS